jgi:hypothetical protein
MTDTIDKIDFVTEVWKILRIMDQRNCAQAYVLKEQDGYELVIGQDSDGDQYLIMNDYNAVSEEGHKKERLIISSSSVDSFWDEEKELIQLLELKDGEMTANFKEQSINSLIRSELDHAGKSN